MFLLSKPTPELNPILLCPNGVFINTLSEFFIETGILNSVVLNFERNVEPGTLKLNELPNCIPAILLSLGFNSTNTFMFFINTLPGNVNLPSLNPAEL